MIIKNAKVYKEDHTFEIKDIYVNNGRFCESSDDDEVIDAKGLTAIPGLTDIHFHGCVGHDFCDGTFEATQAIANYQASKGITSICPATMTLPEETLAGICKEASTYNSEEGAMLMGINMEGPFVSLAKKGAQNGSYLRKPDIDMFRRLNKLSGGMIKIVAIAPEEEGAMELIKELKDETILSIAHTTADYDTAMKAFEAGANHVNHLYNAMPSLHHREPGVIGAAADSDCYVEVICDGVHIHPSVIRMTFNIFGDDKIVLISDSMMATGLTDGNYSLGGQAVTVVGNRATLDSGTIAGSATNLMDCLRVCVSFGIPLESAVKCAAENPAKQIGIFDQVGSITPGKFANFVLLDKDLNTVSVFVKGKKITK